MLCHTKSQARFSCNREQWQQEFSSLTGKVIHHMHLNGTFSLKRVLTISSRLNTCFVCITIVDSTCFGPRKESGREKIFLCLVQIESKAHRYIWICTRTRNVFSRAASSVSLVRRTGKNKFTVKKNGPPSPILRYAPGKVIPLVSGGGRQDGATARAAQPIAVAARMVCAAGSI